MEQSNWQLVSTFLAIEKRLVRHERWSQTRAKGRRLGSNVILITMPSNRSEVLLGYSVVNFPWVNNILNSESWCNSSVLAFGRNESMANPNFTTRESQATLCCSFSLSPWVEKAYFSAKFMVFNVAYTTRFCCDFTMNYLLLQCAYCQSRHQIWTLGKNHYERSLSGDGTSYWTASIVSTAGTNSSITYCLAELPISSSRACFVDLTLSLTLYIWISTL